MRLNNFGWDLPPGCSPNDIENAMGEVCDVCHKDLEEENGPTHEVCMKVLCQCCGSPVEDNHFCIINSDCLEAMKSIPDGSIDCVITDPPYGTTACKWDSVISFGLMWKELERVTKKKAAICLFGSQPFTSALVMSNPTMFRYEWCWSKGVGSNFALAKIMPLKSHENILVFSQESAHYFPEKYLRDNPKDYSQCNFRNAGRSITSMRTDQQAVSSQKVFVDKFPTSVLHYSSQSAECNNVNRTHPSQKPVELLRYLVRTYTQEGETVLDFTMGSGSTGVAALLEGRKFIGIEKDAEYFAVAERRLEPLLMQSNLF